MLKSLYIQNYAIIEKLNLEFDNGLNIITGETGAGKSILTGALGLIQGKRADTKVLYDKDIKCIVESSFETESELVKALFNTEEMDFESPVIIRRVINATGKSRAFVNDEPVKLSFLKELSAHLFDMHQQFDTLGIGERTTQTRMLDSLAGTQILLQEYGLIFQEYQRNKRLLKSKLDKMASNQQRLEFLEFQYNELTALELIRDEEEGLESSIVELSNAESIIESMQLIVQLGAEQDANILDLLREMMNRVEEIQGAGEVYSSIYERLNSVSEELDDVIQECSKLADNVESNPALLLEKTERRDKIFRLLQKHQKESFNDLLNLQSDFEEEMTSIRGSSEAVNDLEQSIKESESTLNQLAKEIHELRKEHTPEFEKRVLKSLQALGMKHADFKVNLVFQEEFLQTGKDEVSFVFSANPGKAMEPIGEVASGGELSRLALTLKSLVADNIELGTMIFDEIDTGISGDIAGKMGEVLRDLAKTQQLISITHSPQIASKATRHYFIYKVVENYRTYTKVREMGVEDRIIEIAKMLSGDPPTDFAIQNAKELLAK